MVFFTCSHCGESVKKAAVAKHYQTKCGKKEPFLTCIDCLKDFRGTEYEGHTKCVTEEEKYSAKGSARKQAQGKGEKKQQVWQECIQTLLKKPTLKSDERDFIKAIIKYENVPRKKSRFINFLSNAFKSYANKTDLIDRVWVEMEAVFKELSGNLFEKQQHQQQVQSEQQQQQKSQKQESKNAAKKSAPKPEEPAAKKEKKRKRQAEDGKVAEGGDSGKSEDNQKKKKQKQMEEKPAVGNDDALMFEDKENEREKKNRKRKADEDDQTEQNHSVPDEAEPGKKKKKKKHDKPAENQVTETPAQKPAEESKNKKKNKKPKAEGEQAPKVNNAPTGAGDSVAVKKEKKAKKSENKENEKAPVKNAVANNAQGEAEKPAAKKKKPAAAAVAKAESGGEESKQEMQFDWKATILQVLNQDGKNSRIQLQKLQKKVLKLHCQVLNCEPSEKKEKRFMKKLKEMSEVVLEKDFVVLKS